MPTFTLLYVLHLLAALAWVGGMFFAWMILRPAAVAVLQPPERLRLWLDVFLRFFAWAFLERLKNPPLTRAQITMALEDNVGDPTEVERDFAMRMRAFRESIPAVLASLDSPSVALPPS